MQMYEEKTKSASFLRYFLENIVFRSFPEEKFSENFEIYLHPSPRFNYNIENKLFTRVFESYLPSPFLHLSFTQSVTNPSLDQSSGPSFPSSPDFYVPFQRKRG